MTTTAPVPLQALWERLGNPISYLVGRIVRWRLPRPILQPLLRAYIRHYQVDLSLIDRPLHDFTSIDDFFTRDLKPELRPIEFAPDKVVSPVDGRVHNFGHIEEGTLLQAKGVSYKLATLLGDSQLASQFAGGSYLTIYLSPRDCHHVFSPETGHVHSAAHIPGKLFPVREPFASQLSGLYARNERAVITQHTARGPVATVLVGALNVGNLELPFDRELCVARAGHARQEYSHVHLKRGEKIGTFHLGSTVVVLYPQRVEWAPEIAGRQVCYGEVLGLKAT